MKSLIISFLLLFIFINLKAQTPNVDSLKNVLRSSTTHDTTKIKVLLGLGKHYIRENTKISLNYAHQALYLAEKTNRKKDLVQIYHFISINYIESGIYPDSLFHYNQKALEYAKQMQDTKAEISVLNVLGAIHSNNGDYEKSINTYLNTLKIAQEIKDTSTIIKLLNGIGIGFFQQNDFEKTKKYFNEGLRLAEITQNTKMIGLFAMNIGNLYSNENQLDSALFFLDKALEINRILNNQYDLTHILHNIAHTYENKQQYELAEKYAKESYDINRSLNTDMGQCASLKLLCSIALKQKKYTEVIDLGEKALSLAKTVINVSLQKDIHELLQVAYFETKRYDLAYEHLSQYQILSDSIFNADKIQTINELETKYQVEQKETENKLLKAEQESYQKNIQKRNISVIATLLVLLIVVGWSLSVYRSINRTKAYNKQITEQTEELQHLYTQQSSMFNNIAHELRTPLTLALGSINKFAKSTNEDRQAVNVANRNLKYLQQMINQILDLSKAKTRNLSSTASTFNLTKITDILKNDFLPLAEYQKVNFQSIVATRDIELTTDGEKLFIILKNLLSNAFKYTPSRGSINFSVIDIQDDIQFIVQDTGKGISEEDFPYIFNRFFQTKDKEKLVEGGTGIGLAICKEYSELLQGKIEVNSQKDVGTTFILTIPKVLKGVEVNPHHQLSFIQNQLPPPKIVGIKSFSAKNQEAKPNLLIVEDNLEMANYVVGILEKDYNIRVESNGEEALIALETFTPDLIITDLMMPVMNGYELIEALRASEKWQKIPIITLTALSETVHKLKALRIGVDDYLVKPFNEEELFLRIQHLLENKKKREAFTKEVSNHSDNEPSSSSSNAKELHAIDTEWLEQLETVVKNNIGDVNFTISGLSVELSISSSHLYRKIKRLTGLSPKEYINQIRYTTARQLLESNTYSSVKRVAIEVGFKDGKNFSRNFKKRFGKNPSEYLFNSIYQIER